MVLRALVNLYCLATEPLAVLLIYFASHGNQKCNTSCICTYDVTKGLHMLVCVIRSLALQYLCITAVTCMKYFTTSPVLLAHCNI